MRRRGGDIKEEVKQVASQYLLETYGFDATTREKIVNRASVDIIKNCQALLEGAMGCGDEPTNRCAHRLKGNLNALGLVSFATKAGNIEKAASLCGETEIKAAVLDLYHSIAAAPFI